MEINVDGILTRREREVVPLLVEGLSYKEIGEELGISWCTVRYHAHSIYSKLGVGGGANAKFRLLKALTTDFTDFTDVNN